VNSVLLQNISKLLPKTYKIILLSFIFVLLSGQLFSQYGFQRVYGSVELDTISSIRDVTVIDSTIYFTAGGTFSTGYGLRLGKVNEQGDLVDKMEYDIPNHFQRALFSDVDVDTNFRGNFVNVYRSEDTDFENHGFRLIEYSKDGNVIFDSLYTYIYNEDSLFLFDRSKLIILSDSSYILALNIQNKKSTSSFFDEAGALLMKLKYSGEIVWQKVIYPPVPRGSGLFGLSLKNWNDTLLFHYNHIYFAPTTIFHESWAKQRYVYLDTSGNILSQSVFQDGTNCSSWGEVNTELDSHYIHMYYDSEAKFDEDDKPYYDMTPVIAKFRKDNFDIEWKRTISEKPVENYASLGLSIRRIRMNKDNNIVGAFLETEIFSGSPVDLPYIRTQFVQLLNFDQQGNLNWKRRHYYYPIDSIKDPVYEIKDLEVMPDGGYVLGGQATNQDSISANKPGRFAYLLRTNCLGFLSPPTAQFSYTNEGNEVLFVNNSMNAGSYSWYFGEAASDGGQGDTLHTGENQDSVYHTYEYGGEYDVTLIAHGCNGEADTVTLTINVEQGAYGNIGDDYFTIYPNPIENGGLITVETGNIEDAKLFFFDAQGRKVKEVYLPNEKSIYFIEQAFAAGTYSVRLVKDGEVVQDEKVVVR